MGEVRELCVHEGRGEPGRKRVTSSRQRSVGEWWRAQKGSDCLEIAAHLKSLSAFSIVLAAMGGCHRWKGVFICSCFPFWFFLFCGQLDPFELMPSATDSSVDWWGCYSPLCLSPVFVAFACWRTKCWEQVDSFSEWPSAQRTLLFL